MCSSSRCFECAAECVGPTPSAADDDGPNPPSLPPCHSPRSLAATAPWRTAMAMGLLSGERAAQYSIELLAQWDRKRRPIPLAEGDKPAKHFGKVVLIHLPKLSQTEHNAFVLIRDKRQNLLCFNMQRQKGFIFRGLLVLAPHIGIDWVRHSCLCRTDRSSSPRDSLS